MTGDNFSSFPRHSPVVRAGYLLGPLPHFPPLTLQPARTVLPPLGSHLVEMSQK
uniref:Uncharacterized protein n=1 Tax=Oncorhynchus mykiss TaxID=8022 RepID=A0A8C7VXI0_ONCMY